MTKFLISLIFVLFLFGACGDNHKNSIINDVFSDGVVIIQDENVKITYENKNEIPSNHERLKSNRSHALALIESRANKDNRIALSMIVADYWIKKFVFDGNRISDKGEYYGHWLNFKDDYTFDYGVYEDVKGGGKYHYSHDNQILIMIDDDRSKYPIELNILAKNNLMILEGSNYFGNNPQQIKMERQSQLPTKS